MPDKNFKYFTDNHDKLFNLYPNKNIVIKDEEVKFASDSFDEALSFAAEHYELGTFLIQLCTKDKEGYTQTFHSRVIFA
ncbi:MAG: hypothetical protein A2W86_11825 [Bacteroidetes bacterium GWD2_45_23]|nr:MAG: hypothetical protein A2W87_08190 [Bacteroidetes bacterium GWC2_46_850]OFX70130.1 MAG: hypothetical protein A2071_04600 [Bacteroidetes bacterium GWC1_47_7]OFX85509.1 MAG: hypothetical protein A2W86_11825 [Bacteroidetes bacterium GWD2_45_23]HBB00735.1 hypothetical protein [Porphyromonadaceae bacterium]HCC19360.1 hypothetical protein [Porphyromonadaceae bacterium]